MYNLNERVDIHLVQQIHPRQRRRAMRVRVFRTCAGGASFGASVWLEKKGPGLAGQNRVYGCSSSEKELSHKFD